MRRTACFCSGEVRVFDSTGNVERVIRRTEQGKSPPPDSDPFCHAASRKISPPIKHMASTAFAKRGQPCHDTLLWLISVSLDRPSNELSFGHT
jgi:hypothetical protein